MPLYEYQCEGCGRRTEVLQRVGAPPIGACSECGGAMRKLVSAPAFQFKGSGWYVTDYARKPAATGSGGEGDKPAAAGDTPAAGAAGGPAGKKDAPPPKTSPETAGSKG